MVRQHLAVISSARINPIRMCMLLCGLAAGRDKPAVDSARGTVCRRIVGVADRLVIEINLRQDIG